VAQLREPDRSVPGCRDCPITSSSIHVVSSYLRFCPSSFAPYTGRAPRNKGQRYRADPPTVDEIVAVMRQARQARYGARLNGLIAVLWRAGLRIHEALSLMESDLDPRRGSILVKHGKFRIRNSPWRSSSYPRATQCLLRLAYGGCEQAPAPTHDPRGDRPEQQSGPAASRCRKRESSRPPARHRTSATPRTQLSCRARRTTA
jgi:integrase